MDPVKFNNDKLVTVESFDKRYRVSYNVQQVEHYHRKLIAEVTDINPDEILCYRIRSFRSGHMHEINLTEVLKTKDPSAKQFGPAKAKEKRILRDRKVWKIIKNLELPENTNILGGRFVLSIK